MENIDESILEMKRFLKKLSYVINNEATFDLFGNKYVEKNKIDDIWVCVEANFPKEYKKTLRLPNDKNYKSVALYHQLKYTLQKKSKIFPSCYSIKYSEVVSMINGFLALSEQDIKLLYKDL